MAHKQNPERKDPAKLGQTQKTKTDKPDRKGCGTLVSYCLISLLLWLALIAAKIAGLTTWSWLAVILSAFFIGFLVLMFFYGLAFAAIVFSKSTLRFTYWKRRRKTARTLWESMEGLTLNNIGPIYGIRRQPGEKNKSYKRRILRAARTLDIVNVQNVPQPATGQKLDAIAEKYGIRREKGETDEQLQKRLKEAIIAKI